MLYKILKCLIHQHSFCLICEGSGQRHLWSLCWVWRWGGRSLPGVSISAADLSNQTLHSQHQRWRNGNFTQRLLQTHCFSRLVGGNSDWYRLLIISYEGPLWTRLYLTRKRSFTFSRLQILHQEPGEAVQSFSDQFFACKPAPPVGNTNQQQWHVDLQI